MSPIPFPKLPRGFSLIEVIVSVGVLALAIPLVLAAMLESGNSSASAAAETRSGWIVPTCLDELNAAAHGSSKLVPNTPFGTAFPPAGQVYGIAFDVGGQSIGAVDKTGYDEGVKRLNDKDVRYIAQIEGELLTEKTGFAPLRSIHISIEYPAAAAATKRTKLDFYTQMP
jgi:type II secretory pathway pseudopilin PulG